ncbi:MAG: HRDC domain-containing protein [Planctomycetota bacterium]|nr:HRDC domain-containing protein [Planctomycetota bacterium]
MQARWIQLPFDPVRGTFDDTPLVRALEERPASAVREYFFHFEDRPHLGCFVQWRRPVGATRSSRTTEEELDELLERLDAEERERAEHGLAGFEALEIRRLSPAELAQIERSERKRLQREGKRAPANGKSRRNGHESNGTAESGDTDERDGLARHGANPDVPADDLQSDTPVAEEEPLDGPGQRAAEVLRAWRNTRRRELDVPAYRVLTNRQLEAVARRRPDTLGALAEIGGFGPATLATHGEAILACLKTAELRSHDPEGAQDGPDEPEANASTQSPQPTAKASTAPAEATPPLEPAASS